MDLFLLVTQKMWVRSLGQEDPLEEEMAKHSSILAWEIPWTEEPGGLQTWGCKESDLTEQQQLLVVEEGRSREKHCSSTQTIFSKLQDYVSQNKQRHSFREAEEIFTALGPQ